MMWLQENWIVAVVALFLVIALVWWIVARRRPDNITAPAKPAAPAKPLEPVKPQIIAAEPARFKTPEPAPAPAPPPPVAKAVPAAPKAPPAKPAPAVTPKAAPKTVPKPAAEPAAKPASKPKAKPAAQPAATPAAPPPAATAKADNLQLMKGVGPKLVTLLTGLGITRFDQIAAWTDTDIAAIDPQLGTFAGRITRDNWIDQAGFLARGDKTGFEAKYGALGGEL